jgi:hypothetical protein
MSQSSAETLRREMEEVRCAGLRPPPRIALPEWADTFRRLSASTSAIAGKWRTESVEIARGPMMAVKALLAADLEDDMTATASANLDTCQVLDADVSSKTFIVETGIQVVDLKKNLREAAEMKIKDYCK